MACFGAFSKSSEKQNKNFNKETGLDHLTELKKLLTQIESIYKINKNSFICSFLSVYV